MQGCSFDGVRFRRSRNGSLEDFRFRRRERGTLRSPTPPRGRGARGFRPSRALPGLLWRGVWFPMMQGAVLLTAFVSDEAGTALLRIFVPDDAGVGRSAPLHPLGRRGARGFTPSRALPGLFWWEIRFPSIQVILAIYLRPHGTHWGSGVVAFDQYGACTLTYLSTLDGSRGNTGEVSGLAEMAVRVGARVSLGASFLTEHRIYP